MIKIKRRPKYLQNEKSQTAFESLATYSWAIMVVLIAILALYYFNIINPKELLPSKCAFPVGIHCLDFQVGPSKVVLLLQNNFGETITLDEIYVAKNNGDACFSIGSVRLMDNAKSTISIMDCDNGNVNELYEGTIN